MSDFRDKPASDYFNSGMDKFKLMQYEEAIKDFNEVIRIKPNYELAYYNRGGAKFFLNQYDEAVKDYDKAILLKPDYCWAYARRGDANALLKKYEEAIKDFDKAIKLEDRHYTMYYGRGDAKAILKRYEEAIKDFDKAIQLHPKDNRAYFGRIQCQNQQYQAKLDALQDVVDISEELLKNAKRHKRSANRYFAGSIVSLFIIVGIIIYFVYLNWGKLFDMSLKQHLNLYLYTLPFAFLDMWFIFQFTKNKNLEHSYRHKVSVAKSLASISNGLFNETKDTKLYGEYREYALEQYKYIYKPCENSKQKMVFAVSKGGNKAALDLTT